MVLFQIWLPEIVFENAEGNKETVMDLSTETYVIKKGTFYP